MLYVGLVLWGGRGLEQSRRIAVAGRLLMLVAAAFTWLWTVQQCVPAPANLGKGPYVLFYTRSSGYYWQARHEAQDPAAFLRGYEAFLAEGDYLHLGTHPPGLTLAFRGLIALCESLPTLTQALLATCPPSFRESLETITTLSSQGGQRVTHADQAVLWLAAMITLLAAAGTTAGIYGMVHRHYDRATAWGVAGLWPLVPASAVFHPKSDTLFPLLAVAAAGVWLSACDRRSLLRAITAGILLWLGMVLSLAFLTIGLLMSVMTAWEWRPRGRQSHPSVTATTHPAPTLRRRAMLLLAGAGGFAAPAVAMGLLGGINLLNVWWWNLTNHAAFYDHNARTWWKWLLVNPWELALAVGLPICAAAVLALWGLSRDRALFSERAAVPGGFLLVGGLLWLSGKNMGEAARLWILLMPWVVMSTASLLDSRPSVAEGSPAEGGRCVGGLVSPTAMILTAQMIVCVLTVFRIDGFHFTELVATFSGPAVN
jgi:hypothetical protein